MRAIILLSAKGVPMAKKKFNKISKSAGEIDRLSCQLASVIREMHRYDHLGAGVSFAKVEALLEKGAHPHYILSDGGGVTPLMNAIKSSGVDAAEIALMLIDRGADIHEKDANGMNALMYAVWKDQEVIAKSLIDKGARRNARDRYNCRAIDFAVGTALMAAERKKINPNMILMLSP